MSKLTAYDKFIQQALKYGFSLFGLPKTGQTTSYVTNDDGDVKKGYPQTPPRFVDNGDGTITDKATGLMWAKDGGGVACNHGNSIAWEGGVDYCTDLVFAGYDDWRLPNVKELMSIIDYERRSPCVDETFFPNTVDGHYWSSTTTKYSTDRAWSPGFTNGGIASYLKAYTEKIRPVRGGV